MPHTIKIENIATDDYQRLKSEAAAPNGDAWLRNVAPMIAEQLNAVERLSVRNLARILCSIAPVKPGRPNPKGKPIKQRKGKKRGIRRAKAKPNPDWTPETQRQWEADLAQLGDDERFR